MKKDWMPVVAGVLEIVAGVCAFIGTAAVIFAVALINYLPEVQEEDVPVELLTGFLVCIGIGLAILGLVGVIGGIFAVRRRGFGWAMAGSIAALFTATPLGVIALILVLVAEREFGGRGHEPVATPGPPPA